MNSFSRADRVGGKIQKTLSDILQKKVSDPRLEMVTITGVKMSRDLRIAKIYFTIAGEGQKGKQDAIDGFKSASGYVKQKLARELGLRYMPALKFFYDDSFDVGARIESLLKSVKTENGSDNISTE